MVTRSIEYPGKKGEIPGKEKDSAFSFIISVYIDIRKTAELVLNKRRLVPLSKTSEGASRRSN